jgi:beta-phosphoglucomutase
MLAGVIFDLDGVLADTHAVHRRAWGQFLQERGRQVSEQEMDFVLEGFKREDILLHFLGNLSAAELRNYGERKDELFEQSADQVAAIPGVMEFIQQCESAGLSLAVATSAGKRRAQALLERLGLAGRFSAIVSGDDVSRGKPDPSVFKQAAAGMRLPADRLLVAEDSQAGVRAAKRAGMKCLGLARGARVSKLYHDGADWVVGDFRDTSLALIEQLFSAGKVEAEIQLRGGVFSRIEEQNL